MSGRGHCYANAVVESFFRTLNADRDDRVWRTRTEATAAIGGYIDGSYNTRRLHSTRPWAFEHQWRAAA